MSRPIPRRRLAWFTAAAIAVALLASACGGAAPPASGDVESGAGAADAPTIVATDNEFDPQSVQVPPGEPVTFTISNEGNSAHNFVIDELDVSSGTIQPGDAVTATFTVPDGGAEFVCTFHGGMTGRIEAAP